MTADARDWLPPGAASGARSRAKVAEAVQAWSQHWIARGSFVAGDVRERSSLLIGHDDWKSFGGALALRATPMAIDKMLAAALDLSGETLPDGARDRMLFDGFAKMMLDDLADRLERSLVDKALQRSRPPRAGDVWVQVAVADGSGKDLFLISIPVATMASTLKKGCPRATAAPMQGLRRSLAALDIVVEASLGEVELPLTAVSGLRPGDILVMPLRLEDPVKVSVQGSGRTMAAARLAAQDGKVALQFQNAV